MPCIAASLWLQPTLGPRRRRHIGGPVEPPTARPPPALGAGRRGQIRIARAGRRNSARAHDRGVAPIGVGPEPCEMGRAPRRSRSRSPAGTSASASSRSTSPATIPATGSPARPAPPELRCSPPAGPRRLRARGWLRRPTSRFGLLLAAAGFAWFVPEWNNPERRLGARVHGRARALRGLPAARRRTPRSRYPARPARLPGRGSGGRVGIRRRAARARRAAGPVLRPAGEGCAQCPRNLLLADRAAAAREDLTRAGLYLGARLGGRPRRPRACEARARHARGPAGRSRRRRVPRARRGHVRDLARARVRRRTDRTSAGCGSRRPPRSSAWPHSRRAGSGFGPPRRGRGRAPRRRARAVAAAGRPAGRARRDRRRPDARARVSAG